MDVRRKRSLTLLAGAVGLVMVVTVGVAPEAAAATISGPYVPGTTAPETDQGATVEWKVTEAELCPGGLWTVSETGDSSGLSDITASPAAGFGALSSTVTATVTGEIGSTAVLRLSVSFVAFGDPICAQGVLVEDSFTIKDPLAPDVTPTTASLNYKRALPGFTGKLNAESGCAAERKVQLFKRDAGPDTKLDTKTSSATGGYTFKGKAKNGTYYVKAPKDDRGEVICGAAKSDTVKVG